MVILLTDESGVLAAWNQYTTALVDHIGTWNADHKYVLFWGVSVIATLVLGGILVLYVWVASRQVRPRKTPQARADLPSSPTTKRMRHNSRSFSDLQELDRERREENALLDRTDTMAFPASLQEKYGPEQRKWVYDTLAKVFSFMKTALFEALVMELELVHYNEGDAIFQRGAHDGSILIVASGEASLTIHDDATGKQFTRTVEPGDTITSSLPLLAKLVQHQQLTHTIDAALNAKVCGNLSACALKDSTVLLRVPFCAVESAMNRFPDSFYRLAQAGFTQVEKITANALIDHFGLASSIFSPVPLLSLVDEEHPERTHHGLHQAIDRVLESLGVTQGESVELVRKRSKIVKKSSHQIIEEADIAVSGVYFVLDGQVSVQLLKKPSKPKLYDACVGHQIGLVPCIVGNQAPLRLFCMKDTTMLWIPHDVMTKALQEKEVSVRTVRHLLNLYSDLVCAVDSSFEWMHLHGGESLFERGDLCDSVFTIISGRLRAVQEHDSKGNIVETTSELIRGATLGALDMLASTRSNSSVFAIRDSQISRMSRNVFDFVVDKHPHVLVHFTRQLAQHFGVSRSLEKAKQEGAMKNKTNKNFLLSLGSAADPSKLPAGATALPLGTVAVLSLTKMTKLETFCAHFFQSLRTIAKTEMVSSERANAFLGDQSMTRSRLAHANLSTWLGDMESSNEIVIYEADAMLTAWTRLCIRQADHILLLCSDVEPPQAFLNEMVDVLQTAWQKKNVVISVVRIRQKEWTLAALDEAAKNAASDSSRTNILKKKLRLLKKQNPMLPRFLLPMEKYEWISYFHNVQAPFEAHEADFLRLARRITGNAVGLVLGGGGARGLAHIGVLRALEECGIHVDVVGGTSIGAFIGAVYALHPHRLDLVMNKAHLLSLGLSSVFEKLRDLTLPITAFFNGSHFNARLREHFFDLGIEDLMLNYFCVSTDIAKSRMSVHRSGHIWKYVRASMSLQGYLPPISEEGSLLLDGGYMNNLPADVMKDEGGVKYVLAVDVASETRRDYFGYGSALSGWWLLWNKLNPFARTVHVPSMGDVSAALAYVASEQQKDRIREEFIDLYLRPPVKDYGTLQFEKMEEIIQVGYDYALPRVKEWVERVFARDPRAHLTRTPLEVTKMNLPQLPLDKPVAQTK